MRTIILLFFLVTFSSVYADLPDVKINVFNPSEMNFIYLRFLEIQSGININQPIHDENDPDWIPLQQYNFNNAKNSNVFWIRTKIRITARTNVNPGMIPQMLVSSYEVYWDGKLLDKNGIIGRNYNEEMPGLFFKRFFLSEEECSPGIHSLVFKISNFHSSSNLRRTFVLFGSVPDIISNISSWLIRFSFLLGIVFISGIFNLFLFLTSRRKSYLIFCTLCLVVLISSIINLYWVFFEVETTFLDTQNVLLPLASTIIGILFPLFFLFEFSRENIKSIAGILVSNLLVYFLFQNSTYFNSFIFYLQGFLTTAIILYGIYKKKNGSIIALLGVIISVIIYLLDFKTGINDQTITSVVIIIFYNLYLAVQFAKREKTEREALLKSSRLENELLKKNINPHFLMNSLNSIVVWLRRDPEKSIKLVNSLADEFRLVSQISNLKLISVEKEIDLCKAHIDIMNYRKGANFCFTTEGIKGTEEIPPMILHTLVENGITHGYENRNEGYFKLHKVETEHCIKYILFNDSNIDNGNTFVEGTGIKYIKARLEESYGNKWKFNCGPDEGGWTASIEIRK